MRRDKQKAEINCRKCRHECILVREKEMVLYLTTTTYVTSFITMREIFKKITTKHSKIGALLAENCL